VSIRMVEGRAQGDVTGAPTEKEDSELHTANVELLRAKTEWFLARADQLRAEKALLDDLGCEARASAEEQEHRTEIAFLELKQKAKEYAALSDLLVEEKKAEILRNTARSIEQTTRTASRNERIGDQPRRPQTSSRPRPDVQQRRQQGGLTTTIRGVEALRAMKEESKPGSEPPTQSQ
jgi:hypothetical protein